MVETAASAAKNTADKADKTDIAPALPVAAPP